MGHWFKTASRMGGCRSSTPRNARLTPPAALSASFPTAAADQRPSGRGLSSTAGANMPRAPEDVDRVSPGAHRQLGSRREAVLVLDLTQTSGAQGAYGAAGCQAAQINALVTTGAEPL